MVECKETFISSGCWCYHRSRALQIVECMVLSMVGSTCLSQYPNRRMLGRHYRFSQRYRRFHCTRKNALLIQESPHIVQNGVLGEDGGVSYIAWQVVLPELCMKIIEFVVIDQRVTLSSVSATYHAVWQTTLSGHYGNNSLTWTMVSVFAGNLIGLSSKESQVRLNQYVFCAAVISS